MPGPAAPRPQGRPASTDWPDADVAAVRDMRAAGEPFRRIADALTARGPVPRSMASVRALAAKHRIPSPRSARRGPTGGAVRGRASKWNRGGPGVAAPRVWARSCLCCGAGFVADSPFLRLAPGCRAGAAEAMIVV